MVGALVGLGQGKIDLDFLRQLVENPHDYPLGELSKHNISRAPGEGLFLANVAYDESSMQISDELENKTGAEPDEE